MTSTLTVLERKIGPDNPVWIIAEVGINHGGDEGLCSEMIDAAAQSGADAVKLQTVTPEISYHPVTESYRLFKDSVLPAASLKRLANRARDRGVVLFSTPGDHEALELMRSVGMPAIKISSGLLTNLPLIKSAAATKLPMVMSTGMAFEREVEAAVESARRAGSSEIGLMQCTSLYPAPSAALNLNAMQSLERRFSCPVGYSDHHDGDLACIAAVAMGATMVEKHFTLDPKSKGADHAISLAPEAFAEMVTSLRAVEAMRGSSEKAPDPAERPLRDGRHRRLVAARDLAAGDIMSRSDLLLMRLPVEAQGLPAANLDKVIGRRTVSAVPRLSGLTDEMIEDG